MSSSDEEREQERGLVMVAETGLPHMSQSAKQKGWTQSLVMVPVLVVVPRLLALGTAYLIYWNASKRYDGRMAALDALGDPTGAPKLRLGFLYLAVGIFSVLVNLLNLIPMVYKSQVLPGNAGNLRSNMVIYHVNVVNQQPLPAVVMQEDGEVGEYNRANRALLHFVENGTALAANIILAGLVFSEPVLVLVTLYALGRLWYQVAYAEGGYGFGLCKHAVPFFLHSILVAPVFELLVWLAGVRMLMKVTST